MARFTASKIRASFLWELIEVQSRLVCGEDDIVRLQDQLRQSVMKPFCPTKDSARG